MFMDTRCECCQDANSRHSLKKRDSKILYRSTAFSKTYMAEQRTKRRTKNTWEGRKHLGGLPLHDIGLGIKPVNKTEVYGTKMDKYIRAGNPETRPPIRRNSISNRADIAGQWGGNT